MGVFVQKSIRLDSGGPWLLKSNILSSHRKNYPFTGYQKPFKWWRTLRDIFSWNLKKIFRTSFFLRTSQDLLPANEYSRNKVIVFMNHRFFFHLSLL